MRLSLPFIFFCLFFTNIAGAGGRINQEGRILGPLPVVTSPVLFNTTNADAIVSAMQIFPVTNPWNEDVSGRPVLSNSDAMMAQIGSNLLSNRQSLIAEQEMNFVLIPDNQPTQPITFFNYPDESELDGGVSPIGLYPIPANLPIESWPTQTGSFTLAQWQTNKNNGDRHAIMVEPGKGKIWETWLTRLLNGNWRASNGAKFDLQTNALRPDGWTSGDAAGLPMFPAVVRYDEAERGMVEHACRLVVNQSLYQNYIYPATHYAASASNTSVNLPAMGQRLRLKASYNIPTNFTKESKAVLLGLKKYGALVADNGNFFSISVTPDDRWPQNCFDNLTTVGITNFEVVQSTGPNEGPRSPNAPSVNAGSDQWVLPNYPLPLAGNVNFIGTQPTILWKLYAGPGNVTFGDNTLTNSLATFTVPGMYTLMLSANDSVHAVAYDAVVITVSNALMLNATRAGTNLTLNCTAGFFNYVLQQSPTLPATLWNPVLTSSTPNISVPIITNASSFFRVQAH